MINWVGVPGAGCRRAGCRRAGCRRAGCGVPVPAGLPSFHQVTSMSVPRVPSSALVPQPSTAPR